MVWANGKAQASFFFLKNVGLSGLLPLSCLGKNKWGCTLQRISVLVIQYFKRAPTEVVGSSSLLGSEQWTPQLRTVHR